MDPKLVPASDIQVTSKGASPLKTKDVVAVSLSRPSCSGQKGFSMTTCPGPVPVKCDDTGSAAAAVGVADAVPTANVLGGGVRFIEHADRTATAVVITRRVIVPRELPIRPGCASECHRARSRKRNGELPSEASL
ncbi:hypothetical protein DVJ78_03470 [Humibacter sp. BT305]|nr:hypothetical protein DVJ78_03470 [Humibacter sp. BT305]